MNIYFSGPDEQSSSLGLLLASNIFHTNGFWRPESHLSQLTLRTKNITTDELITTSVQQQQNFHGQKLLWRAVHGVKFLNFGHLCDTYLKFTSRLECIPIFPLVFALTTSLNATLTLRSILTKADKQLDFHFPELYLRRVSTQGEPATTISEEEPPSFYLLEYTDTVLPIYCMPVDAVELVTSSNFLVPMLSIDIYSILLFVLASFCYAAVQKKWLAIFHLSRFVLHQVHCNKPNSGTRARVALLVCLCCMSMSAFFEGGITSGLVAPDKPIVFHSLALLHKAGYRSLYTGISGEMDNVEKKFQKTATMESNYTTESGTCFKLYFFKNSVDQIANIVRTSEHSVRMSRTGAVLVEGEMAQTYIKYMARKFPNLSCFDVSGEHMDKLGGNGPMPNVGFRWEGKYKGARRIRAILEGFASAGIGKFYREFLNYRLKLANTEFEPSADNDETENLNEKSEFVTLKGTGQVFKLCGVLWLASGIILVCETICYALKSLK